MQAIEIKFLVAVTFYEKGVNMKDIFYSLFISIVIKNVFVYLH